MKRFILFVALLGLGFSACKKEVTVEPNKETTETIVIARISYPKDSIVNIFEKFSGLSKDRFIFDQEKEQFFISDYNLYISPSDYIKLKK